MSMSLDATLVLKGFDTLSDFKECFQAGDIEAEFFAAADFAPGSRASMVLTRKVKR